MKANDSDGCKEFRTAFEKLKAGFIGMGTEKENRLFSYRLSIIEAGIEEFAEIEYKERV